MKRIKEKSQLPLNDKINLDWSNEFIHNVEGAKVKFDKSKILYDKTPSRPSKTYIEATVYCKLIESKNQIDVYKHQDKMSYWNQWSKLVNPYEKVTQFSQEITTISRAFFKLYEILKVFDVKNINNSLHLCEAPGGFVQATKKLFPSVDWYAQTLYEGGGKLEIDKHLNESKWIRNGDGDICKLDNIKILSNSKYDLITGDGGFDVSHDPNNQEQLSFKLMYGQFLCALYCQQKNGHFVCKIFDSVTKPSCQLIILFKKYYEDVYIIKPRTSRFTNSEKYVYCKNFKGIQQCDLEYLSDILSNWDHKYCRDLGITFNKVTQIKDFNVFLSINQTKYINKAVEYSQSPQKSEISNIQETMQNKRALLFCVAFDLRHDKDVCMHKTMDKISYVNDKIKLKNLYKCNKCLKLFIM